MILNKQLPNFSGWFDLYGDSVLVVSTGVASFDIFCHIKRFLNHIGIFFLIKLQTAFGLFTTIKAYLVL